MYLNIDFQENLVASFIDVASILFAYTVGFHQMGFHVGLGYALFDAWVVIWQRRNITLFIRKFVLRRNGSKLKGDAFEYLPTPVAP